MVRGDACQVGRYNLTSYSPAIMTSVQERLLHATKPCAQGRGGLLPVHGYQSWSGPLQFHHQPDSDNHHCWRSLSGCSTSARAHKAACVTAVGFEPTPLRTGALSQRLRPLGQTVLFLSPHKRSSRRNRGHDIYRRQHLSHERNRQAPLTWIHGRGSAKHGQGWSVGSKRPRMTSKGFSPCPRGLMDKALDL